MIGNWYIDTREKGRKNQWLEFWGTLGSFFNLLTERLESSNPAPEVLLPQTRTGAGALKRAGF